MISFPNAKINIGLHVQRKREDGYHDISTVFYPVEWSDVLEVVKTEENGAVFQQTGLEIADDGNENLCVKAFNKLKQYQDLPGVKIHLHKLIPMGAGLGGGSSDAAFCLKILNELFNGKDGKEQLKTIAASIGADCAFFIDNQPALGTGKGDQLEPVSVKLEGYYILIVHPGIHVSTVDAYKGVVPKVEEITLKEAVKLPVKQWKGVIENHFEKSVFFRYPVIDELKSRLYQQGAVYASMSGSGSAVYGIFEGKPDVVRWEKYHTWCGKCRW